MSTERGTAARLWGPVKLVIKTVAVLIFLTAAAFLALEQYTPEGVPILEYHKVNNRDTDEWTLTTDDFAAHLEYLSEQGYSTISTEQFARYQIGAFKLPPKPIIVTFDDGYDDMLDNMMPMMEAVGMRSTVYMVTNYIGRPHYLDWSDLNRLRRRGFELGSHTANHIPLTEMDNLPAFDEAKYSRIILWWYAHKRVTAFSYPEGKYDDRIVTYLKENDYLTAVTGEPGYNTTTTSPYHLRRVNITRPVKYLPSTTGLRIRLARAKLYHIFGWDIGEER